MENQSMDVIILCGGKGTRLSEETITKPKPMVDIGGMPILWHIMKIYSYYGYKRFILALGYRAEYIKRYFYDLRLTCCDFTLNLDPQCEPQYFNNSADNDWEITFVDTGHDTLKGGRVKRLEKYVTTDRFHVTYGDGVSNVNIQKLVDFHISHGCIGTLTAVHPPSRFGEIILRKGGYVAKFDEKPQMGTGVINGGFFVFERRLMGYLTEDENCDFEFGPLQQIAKEGQLKAYRHGGFWQCMDNVRERDYLDLLVREGKAPWMVWKD